MSERPHGLMDLLPGRISVLFAALMHAAVGGFVVTVGQLLPALVAAGLFGIWLVVAVGIWRNRHHRPLIVLGLPFVVPLLLWASLLWLAES